MGELISIGIRVPKKLLKTVEEKAEEEDVDRSTIIRQLISKGVREYKKEKAANLYREGKLSMSGAAEMADLTIREMIDYLIGKGYRSTYTYEDLKKEIKALDMQQ